MKTPLKDAIITNKDCTWVTICSFIEDLRYDYCLLYSIVNT